MYNIVMKAAKECGMTEEEVWPYIVRLYDDAVRSLMGLERLSE